jgi:hypothetical protein
MLSADSGSRYGSVRLAAMIAALVLAATLSACGGDDQPSDDGEASSQSTEAEAGEPTETMAQPPPEEASGEATSERASERSQEALAEDAATGPQSCSDVTVTPNSGNGLFAVEAEGITCEDASAALQAWGASGYPGEGPPGFACEEIAENDDGSIRLSCEQDASGGLVEFDSGG